MINPALPRIRIAATEPPIIQGADSGVLGLTSGDLVPVSVIDGGRGLPGLGTTEDVLTTVGAGKVLVVG